jgi:hypothetical protein
MIRSILSVITGIVVWGLLWFAANMGIARLFSDKFDENMITTDPGVLGIVIVISFGLSVLAGVLCAAIARRAMMKHVLILGVIQLGIGIMVQSGVWDQMPQWYHLIFLTLVIPGHLLGGKLRCMRS